MDDELKAYGTTKEVLITFTAQNGKEKTIRLPNANDSIAESTASAFANLAMDSSTAVLGVEGQNGLEVPAKVKIDIVTTTRNLVYNSDNQ